jgi:cellulose synthase/poly-beta-1,6-N-acetylglucosamine synthase-like glycosyltransferase
VIAPPERGATSRDFRTLADSWKEMAQFIYRSAKDHARELRTGNEPRTPPPRSGTVIIVPAHNEEDVIAECIESLLHQTRRADAIVIAADNCTDNTVAVARRYRGVTVVETVDNHDRKAGALGQAWLRYAERYEYVVGVDADSVLAPTCLEDMYEEIAADPAIGGVMARYTFDQAGASTILGRFLVRLQRFEFAGWTVDILHRKRKTYVLGGQATMFRAQALVDVTLGMKRPVPWTHKSQVEDMELTWALRDLGWDATISSTARAYVGPMVTLRSFWAQRRKWDEGLARLLLQSGFNQATRYPWRMQAKMALDWAIRVLFIFLTVISVATGTFHWYWIWAIPPLLAIMLNIRTLRRMPNCTFGDVFAAVTLIPVELYLMLRMAVWMTSWLSIAFGVKRDGWARQYAAEGKAEPSKIEVVEPEPEPEPVTGPAPASAPAPAPALR